MSAIASQRVRVLAEKISHDWEQFTDEEKLEVLALVSAPRMLDASTVEKMLAKMGGNITAAAKALGVARRTLQNRMRDFGMPTGQPGRRMR
jgi:transcriptional regulator with GAF, ATPase, and Fis domain